MKMLNFVFPVYSNNMGVNPRCNFTKILLRYTIDRVLTFVPQTHREYLENLVRRSMLITARNALIGIHNFTISAEYLRDVQRLIMRVNSQIAHVIGRRIRLEISFKRAVLEEFDVVMD